MPALGIHPFLQEPAEQFVHTSLVGILIEVSHRASVPLHQTVW